ncbi:MAG: ergothioneine biosynthesis protein EgtB [endosymbiont of Galathealinum brachiosum]|uniref:Ergothioneine biosynthesis protein EgtB n=1 Tax=endosymbiont of Galathealinum brachiosum TaxID=2200906 RepID=A0A370DDH9_9GAMM|nr:MAG: ergothioneine biosynthesis protein EgtB [endosymbiont of Galathealinum brachiosum]
MPDSKLTSQEIESLITDLKDSRQRTLALINDLDSQQLIGPMLDTVNPLLWEIGHTAYFYEYWILRGLHGADSFLENADALYDSITIAHNDRWDLPLLSLDETKHYMQQVLDAVIQVLLSSRVTVQDVYLSRYGGFHEDMHTEAFTYTRRTLNYPSPSLPDCYFNAEQVNAVPLEGDVNIKGGEYLLGAAEDIEFCFDNEKWLHPVQVKAFAISRTATSYQQYADFVDNDGYNNKQFWDDEGWQWLQSNNISAPNGWEKDDNGNWLIKQFDQWITLRPNAAVIHINWYEAKAWCRWAGRRLPSEAEWELAASGSPDNINEKRTFPWGNEAPTTKLANLDGYAMDTIDVNALAEGDSAFGCRQMIGNTWEWVEDTFNPYPGFVADMYEDYSQPLFGQTRVLRGGAWTTRARMIRNTWRTYYGPDRNDVFAGFRSCAL